MATKTTLPDPPKLELKRGRYSPIIHLWNREYARWARTYGHRGDVAHKHDDRFRTEFIGRLIDSLAMYADNHWHITQSRIGEDGLLGPAWAHMVKNVRVLLNGPLGGLSGGQCDTILLELLRAEGYLDENGEPRIGE